MSMNAEEKDAVFKPPAHRRPPPSPAYRTGSHSSTPHASLTISGASAITRSPAPPPAACARRRLRPPGEVPSANHRSGR